MSERLKNASPEFTIPLGIVKAIKNWNYKHILCYTFKNIDK